MTNEIKPNLKIKLDTAEQFNTAWEALKRMGYQAKKMPKEGALYIYAFSSGGLIVDFPNDGDCKDRVSADDHFEASLHRSVTLDVLLEIVQANLASNKNRQHDVVVRELPLFEANSTRMGFDLEAIQWDHELFAYQLKDTALDHENEDILEQQKSHASFMTSLFKVWLLAIESRNPIILKA